jgi:hypothetical protein
MFRSILTHKWLYFPVALVLVVVIAAAAVFALTSQPSPTANLKIPDTGRPTSVPIELERGYNLKVDQSQYKVIPLIITNIGHLVSVPIELERGYNLKENQSQYK